MDDVFPAEGFLFTQDELSEQWLDIRVASQPSFDAPAVSPQVFAEQAAVVAVEVPRLLQLTIRAVCESVAATTDDRLWPRSKISDTQLHDFLSAMRQARREGGFLHSHCQTVDRLVNLLDQAVREGRVVFLHF
ncbi:MAG: hypothetical protein NXI04_07150 [Planctomycetaceae bacterium]|nr:hypothetical protein [Planctomycetaceae bacterium]